MVVIVGFFVSLLNSLYWISDYFTGNGITNATIYHIRYGFGGVNFGQYKDIVIGTVVFIIGILILLWRTVSATYHNKTGKTLYVSAAIFCLVVAVGLSPAVPDLYHVYILLKGDSPTSTGDGFYSFYREPVIQQTGNKKNLVFIYAESLEQTYSDEESFPQLTEGLNGLKKKSIYFTDIEQTFGANYTIAGFVSSQCGIPLVGPAYGNSMSGMDTYLPLAVCLGDLLNKEGYHMAYYGGANLSFAGKDSFLRTHGFDERKGLQELLSATEFGLYRNEWGLYDDSLFALTYARFLELSRKNDPFALFALTLDTHQPRGSQSESCHDISYQNGSNQTLNEVACSDFLISQFVNMIIASPYAKDTVIVIASDHLAPHDPTKDLSPRPKRSNRFMIIPPSDFVPKEIKKLGLTFDIGPTILPFIGYTGAIGLGRNLLGSEWQAESEAETIQKSIPIWMGPLKHFWDFPKIIGDVEINESEKVMTIEGRKFKVPVLVELDHDLQTTLKFQFDLEFDASGKKGERDLLSLTKNLDEDTAFLLVHRCEKINEITGAVYPGEFCLLMGKGGKYSVSPIVGIYHLSVKDIVRLVGL